MSTTQEIIRELDNLRESNTVRNFNNIFLATSKRLEALEADNARLQADNARLREALTPFATIGQLFSASAGDTQWRESPLFYCGTREDPQSHTLTGMAFDRARAALAGSGT